MLVDPRVADDGECASDATFPDDGLLIDSGIVRLTSFKQRLSAASSSDWCKGMAFSYGASSGGNGILSDVFTEASDDSPRSILSACIALNESCIL